MSCKNSILYFNISDFLRSVLLILTYTVFIKVDLLLLTLLFPEWPTHYQQMSAPVIHSNDAPCWNEIQPMSQKKKITFIYRSISCRVQEIHDGSSVTCRTENKQTCTCIRHFMIWIWDLPIKKREKCRYSRKGLFKTWFKHIYLINQSAGFE